MNGDGKGYTDSVSNGVQLQDKKCACSDWSSEQLTPFAQSFTTLAASFWIPEADSIMAWPEAASHKGPNRFTMQCDSHLHVSHASIFDIFLT